MSGPQDYCVSICLVREIYVEVGEVTTDLIDRHKEDNHATFSYLHYHSEKVSLSNP